MFEPSYDRKSQRLEDYDYASGTMYITICIHQHKMLLGSISDYRMKYNDFGDFVHNYLSAYKQDRVYIHAFVVMPNHVHILLDLFEYQLSKFVTEFKSRSTVYYINKVQYKNWPKFDKRLWQRNYYDHVVRDQRDFLRIEEYIKNNPAQWQHDKFRKG